MSKPRKMLGAADSPAVLSLMQLIETQSKATIARWCLDYAETVILPIYQKRRPRDDRPLQAIQAARDWFDGKLKLPQVKDIILHQCHAARAGGGGGSGCTGRRKSLRTGGFLLPHPHAFSGAGVLWNSGHRLRPCGSP